MIIKLDDKTNTIKSVKRTLLLGLLMILVLINIGCQGAETVKSTIITGDVKGTVIVIVKSDAHFLQDQEDEVYLQLQNYLRRTDIEIINLNTIYFQGYLIGFEIMYHDK